MQRENYQRMNEGMKVLAKQMDLHRERKRVGFKARMEKDY